MLIVFLILIVAFILTLIWMRENINFYRDLYKVEKEENCLLYTSPSPRDA